MTSKSRNMTRCVGVVEGCSEVCNSSGSSMLLVEDAEFVRSECSGVAAATYSFSNLVCCKCPC